MALTPSAPSAAPSASANWTPFTALIGAPRLTPATLAELIDGGQAFRWQREPDDVWLGIWATHIVRLRLNANGALEWSAQFPQQSTPATSAKPPSASASKAAASSLAAKSASTSNANAASTKAAQAQAKLKDQTASALLMYLFGHDTAGAVDALPWRSDPHLARCLEAFPGLTILRQPFGETLLGFLCSATKQIVQIKQMVALLAARTGQPITDSVNRLPTWAELASVPETELRACLLGFRARYVQQSAQFIAARPGWLEETESLPYAEAKARLCELPGVGEKVADCVLLFGAGKLEAFPVDTWIIKAMARRYGLDDWTPAQIAHFGRTHFGANAGLAQQYLFAYERAQGRNIATAENANGE